MYCEYRPDCAATLYPADHAAFQQSADVNLPLNFDHYVVLAETNVSAYYTLYNLTYFHLLRKMGKESFLG